jgi:protein gp37
MAENSKIEWTDHTFNPWIGCTKVSDGCKHCYAETLMDHRYKKVQWGPEGTRVRTSAANWKKPLQWNRQAQAEGRRYKVFCASLADVFEDRPELVEWRRELLDLIIRTPRLDWLLLTKRPENVNRMIEEATGFSEAAMWFHAASPVWIGTSVESQEQAFKRLGHLVAIPAAIRFVSAEPLLGPLNISRWLGYRADMSPRTGIDWVIVGGESGQGARPMHPDWARSIRAQCVAAGVAFFMKQMGGERKPFADIPDDLNIREFPYA